MMRINQLPAKAGINRLDVQIGIAIGICLFTAHFVPMLQTMTACIAVLLCTQNSADTSWKSGVTRLIITVIGGVVGIAVILLNEVILNDWVFILLVMIGVVLTLLCCKLAKVPYITTRIGGLTFVLVVLTKPGLERVNYAIFRLLSTAYGVLVVVIVAAIACLIMKDKAVNSNE